MRAHTLRLAHSNSFFFFFYDMISFTIFSRSWPREATERGEGGERWKCWRNPLDDRYVRRFSASLCCVCVCVSIQFQLAAQYLFLSLPLCLFLFVSIYWCQDALDFISKRNPDFLTLDLFVFFLLVDCNIWVVFEIPALFLIEKRTWKITNKNDVLIKKGRTCFLVYGSTLWLVETKSCSTTSSESCTSKMKLKYSGKTCSD